MGDAPNQPSGASDQIPEDASSAGKSDDSSTSAGIKGGSAEILERIGSVIGAYQLLEPIGEGKFGAVYRASQSGTIRRDVALKILKTGMDTEEVIARFDAERQALAMMDHPNIARIFEAGATGTGRPFFAMELVKGDPITEFCNHGRLDIRQRLKLFLDVCEAVQHAHQKGIIHRDLKPSNILTASHEAGPAVKVIDFGVAKAIGGNLIEKTWETATLDFIGTPQYMSPEQIGGFSPDIDTRTDIHSLGVLLYELLTGRPPIDPRRMSEIGFLETHRAIREEIPLKPSSRVRTLSKQESTAIATSHNAGPEKLARLIKGDLDWIVMKALEKDRERRYGTAAEFAADIRRFLNDKPIVAGPPSPAYRLRKFARRNKVALTAAVLILAILVVTTAFSIREAMRATRQRDLELQSLAEIEAVMGFFKQSILDKATPVEAGGLGVDVPIRESLASAKSGIEEAFAGQPRVEASIRFNLGMTDLFLGEGDAAIVQHENALEMRKSMLGTRHPDTLQSMHYLAVSYVLADRHEEALDLNETTLESRTKVLGPEHPDTLDSMNNLAASYGLAGRHRNALDLHRKALDLTRILFGAKHPDTLSSMNSLAWSLENTGDFDGALKLRKETLTLRERELTKEHPDTLSSMVNLARSYRAAAREKEALKLEEEALELHRRALLLDEKALELRRKILRDEHPQTLDSMEIVATARGDVGRHDDAFALHRELLALRKRRFGPGHNDTLRAMGSLALAYRKAGRLEDAEAQLRNTIAARRRHGRMDWQYFYDESSLGAVIAEQASLETEFLVQEERYEEAEVHLLAGYDGLLRQKTLKERMWLVYSIRRLEALYRAWGKPGKADEWWRKLESLESESTISHG